MNKLNMTNKEISNIILEAVKKYGFKPYDIKYSDGYFVFDMGEDSVVHFKVKGLHGWLFAIWIQNSEEAFKVDFFSQNIHNIDKFKPSRSFFAAEFNNSEDFCDDKISYYFYPINDILKSIKRHPIISFVSDAGTGDFFDCYFIFEYIKERSYQIKKKVKDFLKDWVPYIWSKAKIFLFKNNKIIESVELIDQNSDEWKSYPRFELQIIFKENSTDEKEVKFLNKWFLKDHYGNLSLEYGRVGIDHGYVYIYDKKEGK